ncbi:MAG TPA: prepilin-type N-terminal cleavage/methylation domain-containing protein [Candidatus Sulfotelmatobacter sp.]|nr:prepilin-type N-terminal cleavage/methylation domain-containing protein [Candidatus Sulfotelmatobacter sp.]
MTRQSQSARSSASTQDGFTLAETMIAIVVTSVGIIGLLAVFATAVSTTQNAQQNLIARQKALETMESIYTARNTQQINFAQIANISSGGIFTDGATPLLSAGSDGLVNTADDVDFPAAGACPAGPECITLPGADGILGTTDDTAMSLANFSRQIRIATVLESDGVTVDPNLKQITVTVSYFSGGSTTARSYTVNALISAFR